MTDRPTLEGTVLVAALVARYGAAEPARRLDCAESAVRHWATGRRVPGPPQRERLRAVYEVPLEAWTRRAVPTSTPPAPTAEPPRTTPVRPEANALSELRATIDKIDAAIASAEADPKVSAGQKAQLFNAKVTATRTLARLTGELDVTEARILAHPAWRRLREEMLAALSAFPEALYAVGVALQELEERDHPRDPSLARTRAVLEQHARGATGGSR